MKDLYIKRSQVKKGYKDQLIYYYNNMGKKSEIAGCIITEKLVSVLEKRYKQVGGFLPIKKADILEEKNKTWKYL